MSSDETIPTLLHLAYHRFAQSLCLHQITRTPVPADSPNVEAAYFEMLETEILETFHQTYNTILPKICLDEVPRRIEAIIADMKEDLEDLTIKQSTIRIIMTEKWHDFAVSWWSTCWQRTGEAVFQAIYVTIMKESELEGLETIPEADLALCLDIWHKAPEDWKMETFLYMSKFYTRRTSYPFTQRTCPLDMFRSLKFLTKLFGDFDLQTRLELWMGNWIDYMHGTRPIHLKPLMRMCCDSDRSFDEFKGVWLSKPEIIERLYCSLIRSNHLEELDEFINFYSSDSDKKMELAKQILLTFFIIFPLPESLDNLLRIMLSLKWLTYAVFMPEFEYLRKVDEEKVQSHYRTLIVEANYDTLPFILAICLQRTDVETVEKRYVETFFLENSGPNDTNFHYEWFNSKAFKKLQKFDRFLNRVFDSADEASDFKKRLIYAPCTLDSLRDRIGSNKEGISQVDDFIRLCLSSDREIDDWQDIFMRDIVKGLRRGLNVADLRYCTFNVINWCVNSDEKLAKLKSIIEIDELFEILAQCNETRNDSAKFFFYNYFALNEVLNKWYPQLDDRIEFKLEKLRDYSDCESALDAVLGVSKSKFFESDTDEQKRQVVAETFQREEEPDE